MLSAPQVHALLDHMHARCGGSHSFLAAVRRGTTLTGTESSLKNGPTKLLQSFFDRLPDHQIDREGFYSSNGLGDGSQSLQQGALNLPGGHEFKPSSYAGLQLWNQRHSRGQSDKG